MIWWESQNWIQYRLKSEQESLDLLLIYQEEILEMAIILNIWMKMLISQNIQEE